MRRYLLMSAAVVLAVLGFLPVFFPPKVLKADGKCYWKNVKDQGPIYICPQVIIADGSDPMPLCRPDKNGHPNCPN